MIYLFLQEYRRYYWHYTTSHHLNLEEIIQIIASDQDFLNEEELLSRLLITMPIQENNFWKLLKLWKGKLPMQLYQKMMRLWLDEHISEMSISLVLEVIESSKRAEFIHALISHSSPEVLNCRMQSLVDLNFIVNLGTHEDLQIVLDNQKAKISQLIVDKFRDLEKIICQSFERGEDYRTVILREKDACNEKIISALSHLMSFSQWPIQKYKMLLTSNAQFWHELLKKPSILIVHINHLKNYHFAYFINYVVENIDMIPITGMINVLKRSLISQNQRVIKLIIAVLTRQSRQPYEWSLFLYHLDHSERQRVIQMHYQKILDRIQTPEELKNLLDICGFINYEIILVHLHENFFHNFDEFQAFINQFVGMYQYYLLNFFEYEVFNLGRGLEFSANSIYPIMIRRNEDCLYLLREYIPEHFVLDFIKEVCRRRNFMSIRLALEVIIRHFDVALFQAQHPNQNYAHYFAHQILQLHQHTQMIIFSALPFISSEDLDMMSERLIMYITNIRESNNTEHPLKIARFA